MVTLKQVFKELEKEYDVYDPIAPVAIREGVSKKRINELKQKYGVD